MKKLMMVAMAAILVGCRGGAGPTVQDTNKVTSDSVRTGAWSPIAVQFVQLVFPDGSVKTIGECNGGQTNQPCYVLTVQQENAMGWVTIIGGKTAGAVSYTVQLTN